MDSFGCGYGADGKADGSGYAIESCLECSPPCGDVWEASSLWMEGRNRTWSVCSTIVR
jgi:hypothetical protein